MAMEVSSEMAKVGQKPSKKLWAGSDKNLTKFLKAYKDAMIRGTESDEQE